MRDNRRARTLEEDGEENEDEETLNGSNPPVIVVGPVLPILVVLEVAALLKYEATHTTARSKANILCVIRVILCVIRGANILFMKILLLVLVMVLVIA
jgi:hypothetical protein